MASNYGLRKKGKMESDPKHQTISAEEFCALLKESNEKGFLKGYLDSIGYCSDEKEDDSSGKTDGSAAPCGVCNSLVGTQGFSCEFCKVWYHYGEKCSGVKIDKQEDILLLDSNNIWFVCNSCMKNDPRKHRTAVKGIEDKLEELKTNSNTLTSLIQNTAVKTGEAAVNMDVLQNKIDNVDRDVRTVTKKKSYAESLKTKKVLLIKSTDEEGKAANEKKAIMSKVTAPVEEVKETKDGHLFVRFADSNDLKKAKDEIESSSSSHNITVNEKGKLDPKIKLVNIPQDEEDIIDNIIMKNRWIESLMHEKDDLKIIRVMKARDDKYRHIIIKCTPAIRKAIYDRGDKLYTLFSCCRVYDHYWPYQCYKCQEFGHNATKCNNNQVCPKCGENHRSSDCTNTVLKCNNCVKKGHSEINHKAYDSTKCTVYKDEMSKARNNTDHGFN